jgi:hypothetical protein
MFAVNGWKPTRLVLGRRQEEQGVKDESAGIRQTHLPQVQDHSAPRHRARDLFGSASQAAAGLIPASTGKPAITVHLRFA